MGKDYGWLWLVAAWLGYFLLHSGLAALHVKARLQARWPALAPWYRLAYNGLAVVLLLPIVWLMWRQPGALLWQWTGAGFWVANGLALAALVGFWISLRWYDSGEFLGLRQLRQTQSGHHEGQLCISPLHRFVRHPWYSFGLVLVWTRDMNLAMFISACAITLYFVIGSRLEEAKLAVFHGEVYRRYCAAVPGLVPRPWRYLSRERAAALEAEARQVAQR